MTTDRERSRRYLLGELADEECTALERAYFARADALEDISAAEDELIEAYLSDRLTAGERSRFERHYLASPVHRTRVAVARSLGEAAVSRDVQPAVVSWWRLAVAPVRGWLSPQWAAALAVLLLLAGVLWIMDLRPGRENGVATTPSLVTAPPPMDAPPPEQTPKAEPALPSPVTVAFSLSPINVRGAGAAPTLLIPSEADGVVLHLEDEPGGRPLVRGRATVRTVTGDEVWQGSVAREGGESSADARALIPAANLPPDDYFVDLFEIDDTGAETERARYFLRVGVR